MRWSFLILIALLISSESFADCGLDLSVSNISLSWTASLPTQAIVITVTKSQKPACNYFLTFSKGGASDYNRRMLNGGTSLSYQLYKELALSNILKEIPDATASNVTSGSFGSGKDQTQNVTYYLSIPYAAATSPTLKPSGTYSDTFSIKVFEGNFGSTTNPVKTKNVNVETAIPKRVDISLVSSGSAFDANSTTQSLNFGTLSTGATRGFDMRVQTNAGFAISFSSQNNGVMKHSSSLVTTVVPYSITVNSASINLSGSSTNPVIVASGSGQTSLDGAVRPVAVTIGEIANQMAGNYSDYITVTAATTD